MKIEIESIDDLNQLVSVLSPAYLRAFNTGLGPDAASAAAGIRRENLRNAQHEVEVSRRLVAEGKITPQDALAGLAHLEARVASAVEPDGLPTDIAPPCTVGYSVSDRNYDEVQKDAEAAHASLVEPERDADGAQYDTRWHSEPKQLTAKNVFRARRGRDNDAYKAWLLEQAVEVAEAAIAADEAEPVATETHALPQDGPELRAVTGEALSGPAVEADNEGLRTFQEMAGTAGAVDLEALIAASLKAAQDASDSHVDLLNACRDFTSKHGHPAFTALKAAVAPEDAGGGGKAVQHFTPGERRLMQACIANYPTHKEA